MKNGLRKILLNPVIAKRVTRWLVKIHQVSYSYLGLFASASEGGLHPKHRLINYHKFFVDNIGNGEIVLDVGCGNGALLKDVAMKTKAYALGVEISEENVKSAKTSLSDLSNVEIVQGDIWEFKDDRRFDTIMLSNVLEHLDRRPELLRHLNEQFKPNKFLIRVPMFEREWLVPYKKELGIESRLDTTHKTEYTEDEFRDELAKANLDIQKIIFKWGEMWAIAIPSGNGTVGYSK